MLSRLQEPEKDKPLTSRRENSGESSERRKRRRNQRRRCLVMWTKKFEDPYEGYEHLTATAHSVTKKGGEGGDRNVQIER